MFGTIIFSADRRVQISLSLKVMYGFFFSFEIVKFSTRQSMRVKLVTENIRTFPIVDFERRIFSKTYI